MAGSFEISVRKSFPSFVVVVQVAGSKTSVTSRNFRFLLWFFATVFLFSFSVTLWQFSILIVLLECWFCWLWLEFSVCPDSAAILRSLAWTGSAVKFWYWSYWRRVLMWLWRWDFMHCFALFSLPKLWKINLIKSTLVPGKLPTCVTTVEIWIPE